MKEAIQTFESLAHAHGMDLSRKTLPSGVTVCADPQTYRLWTFFMAGMRLGEDAEERRKEDWKKTIERFMPQFAEQPIEKCECDCCPHDEEECL